MRRTKELGYYLSIFFLFLFFFFIVDKLPFSELRSYKPFIYDEGRAENFLVDFLTYLSNRSYHPYYLQKSLGFLIVGPILKLIYYFDLTNLEIRTLLHGSMGVFNALCLTVASYYLMKIRVFSAQRNKLKFWTLIYINFGFCIFLSYYSILGEIVSFTVSCGMLYYFLSARYLPLFITIVLSSLANPLLFLTSGLIFSFERKNHESLSFRKIASKNKRYILTFLLFAICFLLFSYGQFYADSEILKINIAWGWPYFFPFWIRIISLILLLPFLYFIAGLFPLERALSTLKNLAARINFVRLFIWLSLVVVNKGYVSCFSKNMNLQDWHTNFDFTFLKGITTLVLYASSKPFANIIGYFLFFGVLTGVFIFGQKKICRFIQLQNLPFALFFTSNAFVLLMDPEGRHVLYFYPWVLFAIFSSCGQYLEKMSLKFVLILNLIVTFHWLPFRILDPAIEATSSFFLTSLGAALTPKTYVYSACLFGLFLWIIYKFQIKPLAFNNAEKRRAIKSGLKP